MLKLALLDIGSNSIHMILTEIQPDFSYKILDRFKDVTRLGEETFKSGQLSPDALARGTDVVKNLATLTRNRGFTRIEAVATSAVREASNGGQLIEAIEQQTGIRVRVVTGQEEARLIYLGVRQSMDFGDRNVLIADVGGGSVELIVGNRNKLLHAASLKLGAIRLKDLYLRPDTTPSAGRLERLKEAVEAQLKAVLPRFKKVGFDDFVGTSGMIGNLAEIMHLHKTDRPIPQLNMARFSFKDVAAAEKLLVKTPLKQRHEIPGVDPKRADVLVPAIIVLRALMERLDIDEITISDKAIREGLLHDFIERHREGIQAEQEIPNVRRRDVLRLARKCQYDPVHTHHVARLCLQIFDQTASAHKLGERAREWLEYAAILHDVGYLINSRQHHKHSYYLIKNCDLVGFTADEIELIANIARYHRKAIPEDDHRTLKDLPPDLRDTLTVLGGILRVGDALDRSHFGVVQSVRCAVSSEAVDISLTATDEAALEIWAARERTDLLGQGLKRTIRFTQTAATEESDA
ncbi:MAG: Ppx/GppA family phosphatase [Nitrospirae bacterium]|nr:MAG: Ppx/GppA family phosphatase [Nitrospirota bacterium]